MNERLWSVSIGKTVISFAKTLFDRTKLSVEEVSLYEEMGVSFKFIEEVLKYPGYYGLTFSHLMTLNIVLSVSHEKTPWDKRVLNTMASVHALLLLAKNEQP